MKTDKLMYQKHIDLIDVIFEMQSNPDGVSYRFIMDKFGCSRRTAERMIESIGKSVFELEVLSLRPKRWRIGRTMPGPPVSAEQVALLQQAAELFERQGMRAQSAQTQLLLTYLRANMDHKRLEQIELDMDTLTKTEGFVSRPGPRENIDDDLIEELKAAILTCNVISFDYPTGNTGKSRRRTVYPYGFLTGSRRYLVAQDPYAGEEQFKYFRLVKISGLHLQSGVYFPRKPDFSIQTLIQDNFGVFHERPSQVVWQFDKSVADEVRDWQFHHSQQMRTLRDGRIEVAFFAGGTTEMAWHLASWGDKVKVVKPARLIAKMRQLRDSILVGD